MTNFPEHPRNMTEDVKNAAVASGSSLFSVLMGFLKPLGEMASSVSAIVGCVVACIMLWRLIRPPAHPVVYPYTPPSPPNQEPSSGTKTVPENATTNPQHP